MTDNKKTQRRKPLSREIVLETALALSQDDGVDFTMRALAERLGVTPMAIYRYFNDRDALKLAVIDQVLAEVLESEEGRWFVHGGQQERDETFDETVQKFRRFSIRYFRIMVKYPDTAKAITYGFLYSPRGQTLMFAGVALLCRLGLETSRAAAVYQAIATHILSIATIEDARRSGEASFELPVALDENVKDDQSRDLITSVVINRGEARMLIGLDLYIAALRAETGIK
ncbi:MAG: TetR/AcrR family transcriptional regulator [Pseudomonadota bacterium]